MHWKRVEAGGGGEGGSGDTVKAREGEGREITVDRNGAERGDKVKAKEGR